MYYLKFAQTFDKFCVRGIIKCLFIKMLFKTINRYLINEHLKFVSAEYSNIHFKNVQKIFHRYLTNEHLNFVSAANVKYTS